MISIYKKEYLRRGEREKEKEKEKRNKIK